MESPSGVSPTNNPPVIESVKPQLTKNNLLLTILLTFLVSASIFGLGGYYLGSQSRKPEPLQPLSVTPTTPVFDTQLSPSPSPIVNTEKIKFSETLSKYCLNNKIALDKLPFSINETLNNVYKINNEIDCFVPEESYASISKIYLSPEISGSVGNIYFFHKNSKWVGIGDTFQSLTNFHQVKIDETSYWLDIKEPGPHGISTLGLWIDLILEKQDLATGTIIRVIDSEILKDQDLLDIVKKYGEKNTEPGFPEYVVVDPVKKTRFIKEIVEIANYHQAFKLPAKNVSSDLSKIIF